MTVEKFLLTKISSVTFSSFARVSVALASRIQFLVAQVFYETKSSKNIQILVYIRVRTDT